MKKSFFLVKVSIFASFYALFLSFLISSNSQKNVITACQGSNMVCNINSNARINAVGDRFSLDITGLTPIDFGSITNNKQEKITFPGPNQKMLYTFTLGTATPAMTKKIEILLMTLPLQEIIKNITNALKNANISFANATSFIASIKSAANEGLKLNALAKTMVKIYRRVSPEKQWAEVATSFFEDTNPGSLLPADATIDTSGVIQIFGTGKPIKIDVSTLR